MRAPALLPCIALVSGLLLAPFRSPGPPLCTAAIVLAAATVSASRGWLRTGSASIAAAFFLMGNAADALRETKSPALRELYRREGERAFVSPRRVEGRLRREPERAREATLLTLDVERVAVAGQEIRVQGGLKVSVRGVHRGRLEVLEAGDRVVFWARLRPPSYFRNPGGFDGAAYLARQEIELLGSTKSGLLVTLDEKGPLWSSFISRLRLRALRRLERALSEETFGVVAALVTGERAGLSPELKRLYQRAGIYHVMAISGAHVALWILFLHGLMRRCGVSASSAHLVLLALLPLYAAFCGARPPVLRAVVMASAVLGARLLSLRSPATNGLALAALLLLVEEPSMLGDAGFQLSFAAMGTIALAMGPLHSRLGFAGRLALPLAISIAAQLGVVPVAAWHFHRLSPVAPIASLAAVPAAAIICILGVTLIAFSEVPLVSGLVAFATTHAVAALNFIAALAAHLPVASLRVGTPSWTWVLLYASGLLLVVSPSRRRFGAGACILVVLVASLSFSWPRKGDVLEMAVLDVGHGDAIVLSLPDGKNVLVDGGGLGGSSLDIGESVLVPYLLDRGVRKLDAVIVTHADYDHVGGLFTVFDELEVKALWEGDPEWALSHRAAYRALHERAARAGVMSHVLTSGESFSWGGVQFEVLAASHPGFESSNDRSVVLRITYGGRSLLLTGDAEQALEAALVRSGADLRADVLKVAHHGSRSSSTEPFLDAVRPRLAIISARRAPSRPLPSARVLHRLRERGIEYLRTDHNGTVTVRIREDGQMSVSTYLRGSVFSFRP